MIYLVIINVLGFLIMGLDKAKAKKQPTLDPLQPSRY